MRSVGIGIIGCGVRARGIARQIIERCPQAKVVALCDPSEHSLALGLEQLNPQAKVCQTPEELATFSDVNWVMIGSINSMHASHAITALTAGKHVFCEKPLATTFEDCQRIQQAYQRHGKMFYVGFTMRHTPFYRKIRQLMDDGSIGYLVSMEFNETLDFNHGGHIHRNWRRHSRNTGSHMLEKCCHDLDLANWIVGALAQYVSSFGGVNFFLPHNARRIEDLGVDAKGRPAYMAWNWDRDTTTNPFLTRDKDVVDNQVVILEYGNGVRATFHTNCNAGIQERRMYLLGSEGAIRADVITGQIEVRRIGWETESEHFTIDEDYQAHAGGDRVMVDELLATMLHDAPPPVGLYEGVNAAVTAFAIEEARRTRQVVDLTSWWARVESSNQEEMKPVASTQPSLSQGVL